MSCTTCHAACACREAGHAAVVEALTARVAALEGHRRAWRTIASRLDELVPAERKAEVEHWFGPDGRLLADAGDA